MDRYNRKFEKVGSMSTGWRPSRGEKIRYFIIASCIMIVQVVGLLIFGLWLGQKVSWLASALGGAAGGLVGLATGTISLYHMALRWEKMALIRLGKQNCPNCKRSFEIDATTCPHCDYDVSTTTQPTSQD